MLHSQKFHMPHCWRACRLFADFPVPTRCNSQRRAKPHRPPPPTTSTSCHASRPPLGCTMAITQGSVGGGGSTRPEPFRLGWVVCRPRGSSPALSSPPAGRLCATQLESQQQHPTRSCCCCSSSPPLGSPPAGRHAARLLPRHSCPPCDPGPRAHPPGGVHRGT